MDAYESVVARLKMLGYTVTDEDRAGIEYLIRKCEREILDSINHRVLPEGLFYVLVDMAAGSFLFDRKESGGLEGVEGFDFSAPAKSITEGDVSITFAGAGDGAASAESRFDALVEKLRKPDPGVLAAYRRMRKCMKPIKKP